MANINQRLNGLNPLSYLGDNAVQPPDFVTKPRPPTTTDSRNFALGDIWLDTTGYPNTLPTNESIYMLVALVGNQATWVNFGGGDLETLTGNTGGAVSPDGADNINVVGDAVTINVAGNPGTNTLIISAVGTGLVSTLTGNSGGAVSPLAGNINVVGTGVITVVGNPGTHTLTVTPSGAVASSFVTNPATGTATPAAGVLTFAGSAGLVPSAAGSTVTYTLGGTIAQSYVCNVGTAVPAAGVLQIQGAGGRTFITIAAGNLVGIQTSDAVSNIFLGNNSGGVAVLSGPGKNIGAGPSTLFSITSGTENSAFGESALKFITSGNYNTGIGSQCGTAYTGAESNNIILGTNAGIVGESSVMRLGNDGSVGGVTTTQAFMNGVFGVTVNAGTGTAMFIDSVGKLGTVVSSARYKENINDMGSYSNVLLKLRPVTFNYKKHSPAVKSVGLIAEEVAVIAPNLVIYDKDGLPETVKYHDLVPMMLNELQKHCRLLAERDLVIADLLNRVRLLEEDKLKCNFN